MAGGPSRPAVGVPAAAVTGRVPPQPARPAHPAHRAGARDRRGGRPAGRRAAGHADRFGRGRQDPPGPRRSPPRPSTSTPAGCGGSSWRRWPIRARVGRAALAALGAREAPGVPAARQLAVALGDQPCAARLRQLRAPVAACAEFVAVCWPAVRPPRCWPPAASRSACRARSPGGCRRCAAPARRPGRRPGAVAVRRRRPVRRTGPPGPAIFAVSDANAPAVAEICHRLDGIPLAIELAAARCRQLSAERIAIELDDRFRLLTGGARTVMARQQTLAASVDWSHDRLDDAEQITFRRLGVFAGPFPLEAAEARRRRGRRPRPRRGVRPPQPPRRQEPRRRRRRAPAARPATGCWRRFAPTPSTGPAPPAS